VHEELAGTCDLCGWIELTWADNQWVCTNCGSSRVTVPPPGSPEAVVYGCECDPEPNNEGRIQPEMGWATFKGCPIHDR
jgi:hypothetical protein